jgi:hypothetical protein
VEEPALYLDEVLMDLLEVEGEHGLGQDLVQVVLVLGVLVELFLLLWHHQDCWID